MSRLVGEQQWLGTTSRQRWVGWVRGGAHGVGVEQEVGGASGVGVEQEVGGASGVGTNGNGGWKGLHRLPSGRVSFSAGVDYVGVHRAWNKTRQFTHSRQLPVLNRHSTVTSSFLPFPCSIVC